MEEEREEVKPGVFKYNTVACRRKSDGADVVIRASAFNDAEYEVPGEEKTEKKVEPKPEAKVETKKVEPKAKA